MSDTTGQHISKKEGKNLSWPHTGQPARDGSLSVASGTGTAQPIGDPVAVGVRRLALVIANVYLLEGAGGEHVLLDTGVRLSAGRIRRRLAGIRPAAVVLTHGHHDHAGAAETLARGWGVPVYAHPLELPYLTGQ